MLFLLEIVIDRESCREFRVFTVLYNFGCANMGPWRHYKFIFTDENLAESVCMGEGIIFF